jgi:hypothetical protein
MRYPPQHAREEPIHVIVPIELRRGRTAMEQSRHGGRSRRIRHGGRSKRSRHDGRSGQDPCPCRAATSGGGRRSRRPPSLSCGSPTCAKRSSPVAAPVASSRTRGRQQRSSRRALLHPCFQMGSDGGGMLASPPMLSVRPFPLTKAELRQWRCASSSPPHHRSSSSTSRWRQRPSYRRTWRTSVGIS